ncbi:uncharacterized protein LOC113305936 [Papaver somniferum]|uniref:uncharacterized protein LOC113305936 n=1 Tax=Papaver somniferum TaxID=3469 RepID=UPI000E6FA258|nr:uncharacterized protein LOC113305936 [Papaver somniferum]
MRGEGRSSPIGIRLRSGTFLKDFIRAANTPLPPSSTPSEFSDLDKEEDNTMGGRPPAPRTLKDLTCPNLDQQPLCIQLNGTIELKPKLIHLLPKFRGLAGEDPYRHLQQFHHVVTSMKQATADADMAMMTTFLFSLVDTAGEWFFCLPPGSITTWNGMKKLFLEKYFPASKAAVIRKEICGLLSNEKKLIDAASGGELTNKTIAEVTSLLENMAANTQQFFTRDEPMVRKVNEVSKSSHLEQRMGNMEKMMHQIAAAVIPSSYTEDVEQASAIYNPGWRGHPNFSYANKQVAVSNPPFNQQGGYQFLQRPQQETQGMSITVSKLEAQAAGKLPLQPLNHKENVNSIELRSGKQVEKSTASPVSHETDLEKEEGETTPKKADSVTNSNSKPLVSTYVTPPPFPSRFSNTKEETLYKEMWEIFKKIEVNIPLIEEIRQVPRYAKFLKELCTNKHKLTGNEVMNVGESASAYLQKKLPPKLKDPCNTGIVIQLADRSNVYPKGVVENVLVQVNELIFPVNFYVLDMSDENSSSSTPLLLDGDVMLPRVAADEKDMKLDMGLVRIPVCRSRAELVMVQLQLKWRHEATDVVGSGRSD